MGKIVFCEGKRDVRFINKFFDSCHHNPCFDRFIAEEMSHDGLFNKETRRIQSFLGGWNDYNILLKSENGKPNLKTGFSFAIGDLASKPVEKHILVDLDNRGFGEFIEDIKERIEQRHHSRGLQIGEMERIGQCPQMVAHEIELQAERGRDPRTGFSVLAFKQDLETAANIDKSDSDEVQSRKMESLLNTGPIDRLLQTTLL